jgi:hydroxypyruvate isomerase
MAGKMAEDELNERPRTLVVNCSILMQDRSVPERLRAVADAGFGAVEFWWPFPTATPSGAEVATFVDTIRNSGLRLTGLNLFAGDMPAGDRGVLSWLGRENELIASAEIARDIGGALGTQHFNALYGNRRDGTLAVDQDELAIRNLRRIAPILGAVGGIVMIEPVSGAAAYPIRTAADAAAVLDQAQALDGPENLGLLFDLYHLAVNGDDVAVAIREFGDRAVHVQLADAPGRGAPGTGELPLADWVRELREVGYGGAVALEYAAPGKDPFAGLDAETWRELA